MQSGQVATNSSTATLIVAAANANTIYVGKGQTPRTVVLLNVDASNDVYIGNASVTSGNGYRLAHTTSVTLTLDANDALYGLALSSTPTIHFLESGT
jgi:hypothetical protein